MAQGDPRELKSTPTAVLEKLPIAVSIADATRPDMPLCYVNAEFERLTGYTRGRALGRNCRFLQGAETEPDAVRTLREAIAAGEDVAVTLTNHCADGTAFRNRVRLSPIRAEGDADGAPALYLATQQKVGETAGDLTGLDRLAELQHRVKNHLAMIVGLIRGQARAAGEGVDFTPLMTRVEALQLLYEEMAAPGGREEDGEGRVPLGAYLSRIAAAVAHLDGRPGVRNTVDADEVIVSVGLAGRVGLLVNELLTNAHQHAFAGRETGLVETRVQTLSDGRVRVTISDDGVGLSGAEDWPASGSLGSRIVASILKGLSASYDVRSAMTGTVIIIDFPVNGATPETGAPDRA